MSAANLFQNDPAMSRHKWSLEKSIKGQTQDSSNLKVRWVNRGGPMCLLGSGWYNVMKNSGNGPLHAIGGQWVFECGIGLGRDGAYFGLSKGAPKKKIKWRKHQINYFFKGKMTNSTQHHPHILQDYGDRAAFLGGVVSVCKRVLASMGCAQEQHKAWNSLGIRRTSSTLSVFQPIMPPTSGKEDIHFFGFKSLFNFYMVPA